MGIFVARVRKREREENNHSRMRTILILTSKTGGGHVSLAESLRDQLQADENLQIEILDPQSSFFHWHYRLVSRYALWLWSAEFRLIDTPARARVAHGVFTLLVARALRTAIQRLRPALIITTYPFLTREVMQVLKSLKTAIPFVMLFTDPKALHASWLTEKEASAALAPTKETYQRAIEAGFIPARLHQVGWPVRAQFSQQATQATAASRTSILQQLGLNPAYFTVFLQGGGEGSAQFGQAIEQLLGTDEQLQIILATGTNQALQARFRQVKNVYPLPFTKDIATYMAAADVIMGKAGPNMLFEAVTLGKPFIATTYIPGQEEANLEFIRQHQLGWVTLTLAEQCTLLKKLVAQREVLQKMEQTVAAYQQWNNTQTALIVPLLRQILT
ncbi:MGDG synthase family glycosyltransferase [Dictyobacter formicarum]|uniref:Galactosyldiacylglycerol synthase n=1 Tax=Dictyobacter formicarum TaxID=2778368 RepID=A0ABQ3VP18_9CHLR|nr:glycosyltransferase [Dictyobacter formicarum]GHO86836.1 galactosyldiacylglycerol synthase [Dictyobacter formicarum]